MYDPIKELEHFGVKGQRWGVIRTPEQLGHRQEAKLKRYKVKEIRKVEKRIASDEKYVKKQNAKFQKKLTKNQTNPRFGKQVSRNAFMREDLILRNRQNRKEIESIKKMSYKDMQNDRLEAGKRAIANIRSYLSFRFDYFDY